VASRRTPDKAARTLSRKPAPVFDVGEDRRNDDPVLLVEAALERLPQRRQLRAQLALASSARTAGSVVPRQSASSITRPEAARMSLATQSGLIPVSSRILCSRLASR
jgi:hypothetical protein